MLMLRPTLTPPLPAERIDDLYRRLGRGVMVHALNAGQTMLRLAQHGSPEQQIHAVQHSSLIPCMATLLLGSGEAAGTGTAAVCGIPASEDTEAHLRVYEHVVVALTLLVQVDNKVGGWWWRFCRFL